MNSVKVLIEGYAKILPDGTWNATSTTTFIDTGKHKIIMDPGCHRQLLLPALKKEKLEVGDIDYVFVSHYHPDHCLLIGIFPNATVFDSIQYQKGPIGGETGEYLPDTDVQIIKTPGHTPDHASLLVLTPQGRALIAADVFWNSPAPMLSKSPILLFPATEKNLMFNPQHSRRVDRPSVFPDFQMQMRPRRPAGGPD